MDAQNTMIVDLPEDYSTLAVDIKLQEVVESLVQHKLFQFLLKEIAHFHKEIRNENVLLMTDDALSYGKIVGMDDINSIGYCWKKIPILSIDSPVLTAPKELTVTCNRLYLHRETEIH
jgi:hypothetical protein